MEREEGNIRRRERRIPGQITPGRGGRVGLTGAESPFGRGAHGRPHGVGQGASRLLTSLARSLGSSAVSWASELRFQIRFWITNHDSLMHDDNYTTLKNG